MCGNAKLAASEVHLWLIPLVFQEAGIHCNRKLLSRDEIQRADRYGFEPDRRRFIVARTAMRKILAHYVDIAPQELIFSYSAKGKPGLLAGLKEMGIKFNLSHSGDFALLAVTQGLCVGVDIESVNYEFATDAIAKRFFPQVR
jgi:4'-phosphopantetheinyl transferase